MNYLSWFNKERALYMFLGLLAVLIVIALARVGGVKGDLSTAQESLSGSIEQLDGDIGNINKNLIALEEKVDSQNIKVGNDLSVIVEALGDLSVKVEELGDKVGGIEYNESIIQSGKADVEAVKQSLNNMQSILSNMNERIGDLEAYIYSGAGLLAYYNHENGFSAECEWADCYGSVLVGQQFVIGKRMDICRVKIYGKKVGGVPSSVRADIYQVDGLGHPIGSPMTSGWADAGSWGVSPAWHGFDLVSYPLTPGILYSLVLSSGGSKADNCVAIGYNDDGYDNGVFVKSVDDGDRWSLKSGYDMGFEIWGIRKPA